MRTPIPPDVASGGFYDDNEGNDRDAAWLIQNALGNSALGGYLVAENLSLMNFIPLDEGFSLDLPIDFSRNNQQYPDQN